ncbi:MAG: ATP-dependent sacrificial sulfur transferase LarE [Spirochaetes bacterium]|nr:ATP-dependent sacrificial sulfur transferase LarE [Spirochaetota bacterium]
MTNTPADGRKLFNLKNNIKSYSKAGVAFSGGSDSTFLLAVCADALGKDNVAAVTAHSNVHTESELSEAKMFADTLGIHYIIIETDALSDPVFSSNPEDRCYYCKKRFYSKALAVLKETDIDVLLDGSNADDLSDYRPGYMAVRELGITSPLLEAGFTKDEIRALSKSMNLPTWNKPANPCLATRIPYGNAITGEKLGTIAKAEAFIRSLGFGIVRVRHHDETARIEIPATDIYRFMQDNIRQQVHQYLKSLGFAWITLDMEGYRTGSLNKAKE